MRKLNFSLNIEELDPDLLLVREYEGHESLSDHQSCYGFRYQIQLASRQHDITPDQTVDRKASFVITENNKIVQTVHGIVRAFYKGNTGHHHTFYTLTLVPELERLSLRHNSRVFQYKTVPEIIQLLLKEMGIHDTLFSLFQKYQTREFCIQYRESDLDFIHRIAAEEGLIYYFNHSKNKHIVIFTDTTQNLTERPAIIYNADGGSVADKPYVYQLTERVRSEVSDVTLRDYSFKNPAYSFQQEHAAQDINYQRSYEHYDMPGRYKDVQTGQKFGECRLEYLRRTAHIATGKSNRADIQAGIKFTLTGHPDSKCNRAWAVVSSIHKGRQHQCLEEDASNGDTTYNNEFTLIPSHHQWRATPVAKPQIDGATIAIVTGPEGEEVFCDEHGRVKIHFPWDRESQRNEHSSCWVRVSQGWAGAQYGMMAIPRIGHEVIVTFLNGDPDQPIITGRTYNADNIPPHSLPANYTKTTLKTQTHKGVGYNELSFDDLADNQLVYLRAQKNHLQEIYHNQVFKVGNDRNKEVANDQRLKIGRDEFNEIVHDQTNSIGNNQTLDIGQDKLTTINRHYRLEVKDRRHEYSRANHDLEVGGHLTQKIAGKVHIEGGESVFVHTKNLTLNGTDKVTIQGPSGKIIINKTGITLEAPKIKLKAPVAILTGSKSQLTALKSAADEGTPMVDICSDCGD